MLKQRILRPNFILVVLLLLGGLLVLCLGLQSGLKSGTLPSGGYTVRDCRGAELQLPGKPQRIASLSVSADEMLLGLVGVERLQAVSAWSGDPSVSCIAEQVKQIPQRLRGGNAEAILALKADLVVVPDYTREEVVKTLREAGCLVYVCKTPHRLEEVKSTLRELGKLVQEEQQAENMVRELEQRLQKITRQVAAIPQEQRLEVLLLQENGSYYAPDSSFREVCELAGLQDAAQKLHYSYPCILSQEEIVLLNPDAFIIEDWNYDGRHDAKVLQKFVLSNKAYAGTKAYEQQRAILIPASHLLTVSQYMVEGIEDMAVALYPKYVKR